MNTLDSFRVTSSLPDIVLKKKNFCVFSTVYSISSFDSCITAIPNYEVGFWGHPVQV